MAKKLLLIEDEQYLVEMYKLKFETEGYEVVTAMDGEAGLAMARKENPDLVLLDIVIPKLNGYEVLKAIRNDPQIKGLKVFVLSNLGQKAEIKKGLEDGADGYLVKANMTPGQLVAKVKEVIGEP